MSVTNRLLTLKRRPAGRLQESDFGLLEQDLPDLAAGEVLVRNTWLSIDPSIRIRLQARTPAGYMPPFEIGEPLVGLALGVVQESRHKDFSPGQTVSHMYGYRDYAVVQPGGPTIGGYGALTKVTQNEFPIQWQLGPLGSSGLTAYAGLIAVANLQPSDTVWISAAAGAVGSIAAQVAKLRGATVIGSAGSPAKIDYLRTTLGLDGAFDYHDGPVADLLAAAAPEGIDLYFDNVGSDHLSAAIDHMRPGGRIAMCGAVSEYETLTEPPTPSNLFQIVSKEITIKGFRAGSYNHLMQAMQDEVGTYLRVGSMKYSELVFHSLNEAPNAIVAMLRGDNTGKTLCAL